MDFTQPTTLWKNNIALTHLLGLSPLLAVTTSVANGLGLGLATLVVVTGTEFVVSLTRRVIPYEARIIVFVMIMASLVTAVEFILQAYFNDLFRSLGIFVPLILCNCGILARADVFAYRSGVLASSLDGLVTGLGFVLALVLMGGIRELLGHGTLFSDFEMLIGSPGRGLEVQFAENGGFLLALTPPGAFICLGLLVALHRSMLRESQPSLDTDLKTNNN